MTIAEAKLYVHSLHRRLRGMRAAGPGPGPDGFGLGRLPAPVIYIISVTAERGASLVSLPIMAAYLGAGDYGQYDVAVSFVEFIVLILGLAAGATLIRFASVETSEAASRLCARELAGTSLCLAIAFGLPVVIFGPFVTDALGVATNHQAFRVLLAGACVSGIIELPLYWLRLQDRALTFFTIVMTRTFAQLICMWLALYLGYGVPGIMVANGAVLVVMAAILLMMQTRDTGLGVSARAFYRIVTYGFPIIGAMLAMYALGNSNKLFLPGHVAPETIAHFGLAMRLAMIVTLALAPFELWWGPKRIAALNQAGGLELSARMWGIALALMLCAATGVTLGGSVVVNILLPAEYAGTSQYILPLVALQLLHGTALVSNVGSYARQNGTYVFIIEAVSGGLAVAGYFLLVADYGVAGVMVSIAFGQIVRLALHLWLGQALAPIAYPWLPALICLAVAGVLIAVAPDSDWLVGRTLYTIFGVALMAGAVLATGLAKWPVMPDGIDREPE